MALRNAKQEGLLVDPTKLRGNLRNQLFRRKLVGNAKEAHRTLKGQLLFDKSDQTGDMDGTVKSISGLIAHLNRGTADIPAICKAYSDIAERLDEYDFKDGKVGKAGNSTVVARTLRERIFLPISTSAKKQQRTVLGKHRVGSGRSLTQSASHESLPTRTEQPCSDVKTASTQATDPALLRMFRLPQHTRERRQEQSVNDDTATGVGPGSHHGNISFYTSLDEPRHTKKFTIRSSQSNAPLASTTSRAKKKHERALAMALLKYNEEKARSLLSTSTNQSKSSSAQGRASGGADGSDGSGAFSKLSINSTRML